MTKRQYNRSAASVWAEFNEEMLSKVNWLVVANSIGVQFPDGVDTNKRGWIKCHSVDGSDENPSAAWNMESGYYKDFREGSPAISAYDLMVQLGQCESFSLARQKVASMFGIKWPGDHSDEKYIERGVLWAPWNDSLAQLYCDAKPGITVEGLKAAGARFCSRYGQSCFAFPMYDIDAQVIGWMFIRRDGQPFEGGASEGAKSITKYQEGVSPGFICPANVPLAIRAGKVEPSFVQVGSSGQIDGPEYCIYWCEGITDMLAGYSRFPQHLWVTNGMGCQERLTENQAKFFKFTTSNDNKQINAQVIADCDLPGISTQRYKAWYWTGVNFLATPPFPIEEKHGKDLRDWFRDPRSSTDPRCPMQGMKWWLAENISQELELAGRAPLDMKPDSGEGQKILKDNTDLMKEAEINRQVEQAEKALEKVGLQIVGVDRDGSIHMYSSITNTQRLVKSLSQVKYEDLLSLCGASLQAEVKRTAKEAEMNSFGNDYKYTFDRFKDAIAVIVSTMRTGDMAPIGAGVWRGLSVNGSPTKDVLVVTNRHAYVYNSSGSLDRLRIPVYNNQLAVVGTEHDWFNAKDLAERITSAKCDPSFRSATMAKLVDLIGCWTWERENSPEAIAGLLFSSIIQSMMPWRPTVAVLGPSDCGKSQFVLVLRKLLGNISSVSSGSTTAGICQSVGIDSRITINDEVDQIRDMSKLLSILRSNGRGIGQLMGTAHHKSHRYRFNHIMWFCGIDFDAFDKADVNRTLVFFMEKIAKGFLDLPSDDEIRSLGLDLIACSIATANETIETVETLSRREDVKVSDTRFRESMAVALAPSVSIGGMPIDQVVAKMVSMNEILKDQNDEVLDDTESLLLEILNVTVDLPRECPIGRATVADVLFSDRLEAYRNCIRHQGVAVIVPHEGQLKVSIAGTTIGPKLLPRSSKWHGKRRLNRLLQRLSGAFKDQQNFGVNSMCTSFNYSKMKSWAVERDVKLTADNPTLADLPDSQDGPDGQLLPVEPIKGSILRKATECPEGAASSLTSLESLRQPIV